MLSQLVSGYFARSPVLAWPLLALGLFFTVFVIVSVRALWGERATMQRMAELPFKSGQENDRG